MKMNRKLYLLLLALFSRGKIDIELLILQFESEYARSYSRYKDIKDALYKSDYLDGYTDGVEWGIELLLAKKHELIHWRAK